MSSDLSYNDALLDQLLNFDVEVSPMDDFIFDCMHLSNGTIQGDEEQLSLSPQVCISPCDFVDQTISLGISVPTASRCS